MMLKMKRKISELSGSENSTLHGGDPNNIRQNLVCVSNIVPQEEPPEINASDDQKQRLNVFRLQTAIDLQYDPVPETLSMAPYREAICELCEKTVSLALSVPLAGMQSNTRCNAETALARQIAMYLCHTTFSLLLTEVGLHFNRDRTTVSHACALIEDKRDNLTFDVLVCQLESLLCDARHAMSICVEYDRYEEKPSLDSHLPQNADRSPKENFQWRTSHD